MEALSEVDYVINNLEREEIEKIPIKFREFIMKNKSKSYRVETFENLREETYAILYFIYRKFLASDDEKEELERKFMDKLKSEKRQEVQNTEINYSTKIIEKDDASEVMKEKRAIVEYTEKKWYEKMFEKIKKLFVRGKNRGA